MPRHAGHARALGSSHYSRRSIPLPSRYRECLLLTLALSGCGLLKAPNEEQAVAERFFVNLVAADTQSLARDLDTNLTSAGTWPLVLAIGDSFDLWRPDSLSLIGWNVWTSPSERQADLTYQFHTTRGWMVSTINQARIAGALRIRGFHWQVVPDRLDRLHQFAIKGKPIGAYLMLLLALGVGALSIGTALYLPFTNLPRRWAWAGFALLGCTRFDLNWTTGDTAFNPVTVVVFSAGFQRASVYAPWIISVAFPLGAVLAWQRLLAWRRTPRAADAA